MSPPSSPRGRALALALVLAACGTTPGDDPHAGMSSVASADGRWRVWFATPPWSVVDRSDQRAVLRVAGSQDAVLMGGAAGALVSLVVEPAAMADPGRWVQSQHDEALGRGARSWYGPRAVRYRGATLPFSEAAVGTWDGTTRWAARALPDGRVLTLTFTAPSNIAEDLDLTQIIADTTATGAIP